MRCNLNLTVFLKMSSVVLGQAFKAIKAICPQEDKVLPALSSIRSRVVHMSHNTLSRLMIRESR